jgi:hypothetical protein
MNHCRHMTALAPTAPMRRGRSVGADALALCTAVEGGTVSPARAWQRGVVGKCGFIRPGRGSIEGDGV